MAKTYSAPQLPYNPNRRTQNKGSPPHRPGKRKVWHQQPGELIRDGMRGGKTGEGAK